MASVLVDFFIFRLGLGFSLVEVLLVVLLFDLKHFLLVVKFLVTGARRALDLNIRCRLLSGSNHDVAGGSVMP